MGWIKYFRNNIQCVATDDDIFAKKVSWQNSRNTDILKVEITNKYNEPVLRLIGQGDFWQSDTVEVLIPVGIPKIISRNIQKQIVSSDILFRPKDDKEVLEITIHNILPPMPGGETYLFKKFQIGKWFTLQYVEETGHCYYNIMDNKF